ncbi:cation:proton antiporter [Schaalia sp. lx-260]|uniref:cation:proton antiporter n=1 Tax=Schaalia sp. lx-260 TaxID=2899082 RepID=UPI001E47348C|nr:monovalent cation/H(+) antiporter subunit G [Schaalia sp. lx-260]MCD4548881.1 monovalent cation/H(+) antiporter subunit G [Schaalia sp. lx-260]
MSLRILFTADEVATAFSMNGLFFPHDGQSVLGIAVTAAPPVLHVQVLSALNHIPWSLISQWAGAIFVLCGALLTLIAAIGVAIRKDSYERMHVAAKPQFLGLLFLCTGIVVETWSLYWLAMCTVVIFMQAITVPVGSHLVARAFDRTHRLHEAADGNETVRG